MFLTAEGIWESRKSETQNTLTLDIDLIGGMECRGKGNFWVGRLRFASISLYTCTHISPNGYRFQFLESNFCMYQARVLPRSMGVEFSFCEEDIRCALGRRLERWCFSLIVWGWGRSSLMMWKNAHKKSSWFWYIIWKYGSSIVSSRTCLQHKSKYRIL